MANSVTPPLQIYTHLNNVFELLSKAVVESKQKVNIPKLSKEEPEEKEENEKAKREEERGGAPGSHRLVTGRNPRPDPRPPLPPCPRPRPRLD